MSEPYIHTYRYRVSANEADKIINATYFAKYLRRRGWSLNAICAAFGNWEVETYLNPNYPQYTTFPENRSGGFGMPHWTPWGRKIGEWAYNNYGILPSATDDNPLGFFELQMEFHEYNCRYGSEGGADWYSNGGYTYTWDEWKRSRDDVETLCAAYYYQYERSGSGNPGDRPSRALWYWNYFQENPVYYLPIWLLFKFNRRWRK